MENHCDDSNSSEGSVNVHSPLRFDSGVKPQLSTKATAFSIDALIGKRKFSDLNDSACSSDGEEFCDVKCDAKCRPLCDSVPPKRQRTDACLAPLGKKRMDINSYLAKMLLFSQSFLWRILNKTKKRIKRNTEKQNDFDENSVLSLWKLRQIIFKYT